MRSFVPVLPARHLMMKLLVVLVLFGSMNLQGCKWFKRGGKADERMVETPATYNPAASGTLPDGTGVRPPSAPPETRRPTGLRPAGDRLLVIYFDYDKSEIRPDQLERLDKNLTYLKNTPDAKVLIEGHCDERGSTEYNFSLGERRARSVSEYYTRNGITQSRIQVLSKGKEEAIDPGHNEAAYSKNRRTEFKFFD